MLTDGAAEKRYKSVIVGLFYWACYVVSYSEWKRNSGRNELSVKSGHPLPQSQGEEFRVRSATPRKEPAEVVSSWVRWRTAQCATLFVFQMLICHILIKHEHLL